MFPREGRVRTPEAVEWALQEIGNSLGELGGYGAAGNVGWLFLTALERVTQERDAPQHQSEEQDELVGCSEKEPQRATEH